MKITPEIFYAHLKCSMKCWLRATGESPSGNPYAEWLRTQNELYRVSETERVDAAAANGGGVKVAKSPESKTLKTATWRMSTSVAVQTQIDSCVVDSEIHAVERTPSEGRGKSAQFTPIRFIFTNKLSKDDRLLSAYDAFVLSEILGRKINLGKIIHGDNHVTLNVKAAGLVAQVRKRIKAIVALLSRQTAPDLVLNRHCAECEFQSRCRQKALEQDDLSLLAGMTAKERQKLHTKGIFTVTQLSYTFRPRRRPKRLREIREKYHHSLKALSFREKKIHIVGNPEFNIEGTPVYLDVEGLPDRDFYYLIGMRIGNGDAAVQHSLWADTAADERKIWHDFLRLIDTIEKPVLIHYGSYETTFLKAMSERHGAIPNNLPTTTATHREVNLVSVIFAHIYFPTYSNRLKEITGWLGFGWSNTNLAGTQAIVWRQDWEQSGAAERKQLLISYNSEDCAACELVTSVVSRCCSRSNEADSKEGSTLEFASADRFSVRETMWPKFASQVEGFDAINKAGRWDYQRHRIYIRNEPCLKRIARRQSYTLNGARLINKKIACERTRLCPQCGRKTKGLASATTKILYDLRFSRFGVRRWAVEYHFHVSYCSSCHACFGKPNEFWQGTKYGLNLVAMVVFKIIDLCMQQRSVAQDLNAVFDLGLSVQHVQRIKVKAADFYEETRRKILETMIDGNLIHADETCIPLRNKSAYVWVFATLREVVYFYSDSREADLPAKLLEGFKGVLVSDFYAAYDSIPCPQQKCLVHLMRDINDGVLEYPYDEELRGIVIGFAALLKRIVNTIDRRGLRRHFLQKHRRDVSKFFRELSRATYQSEAALKCKERFEKNCDKLFTFLNHDGVPWNNNNAEHAIKAFARLRKVITGLSTPKGVEDYLIPLSVCQTCKYMGVDFLDFLRSGEKDIYAFAKCRRTHNSICHEVSPGVPAGIE